MSQENCGTPRPKLAKSGWASEPLLELLEPDLGVPNGYIKNSCLRKCINDNGMNYERLARSGIVKSVLTKLGYGRDRDSSARGFIKGDGSHNIRSKDNIGLGLGGR
jgi:hypothetical protein